MDSLNNKNRVNQIRFCIPEHKTKNRDWKSKEQCVGRPFSIQSVVRIK